MRQRARRRPQRQRLHSRPHSRVTLLFICLDWQEHHAGEHLDSIGKSLSGCTCSSMFNIQLMREEDCAIQQLQQSIACVHSEF